MLKNYTLAQKILFLILVVAVLGGLYIIADRFFLPEQAVQVDEELPAEQQTITTNTSQNKRNKNQNKDKNQPEETNAKKQIEQKIKTKTSSSETQNKKGQENTKQVKTSKKILKQGSFVGQTGHTVKGDIKVIEVNNENYLRFENYEQTQGPDVFAYLTPSESPNTREEIEESKKIRINGGPDGGEIVKEGNFNQKLPSDIDPSKYKGVAIWCDEFSVPFGYASLE